MKRWFQKMSVPLTVITIVYWASILSGAESSKCMKCGMSIAKYPHTRLAITASEGKEYATCGVQCGLSLHVHFGDRWRSAVATDLITNRSFDAKIGYYVHGSSVVTDMAPGFIAFKQKDHAEKFAAGFGGRVLDYDEALTLWKEKIKKSR